MDLLMVDLRTAQSKKSLCWQSGHADLESLLPSLSWLLGPICSFLTDYLYFFFINMILSLYISS